LNIQIYSQLISTFIIDVISCIFPYILAYINKKIYLYKTKDYFIEHTKSINTLISEEIKIISTGTINSSNTEISNIFFSKNIITNVKNQLFKQEFDSIKLILNNQKIIIIFGYACFFSVVCPLVPLILALILFVDQYLFCYMVFYLHKVVIIEPANGIGTFNVIFKIFYVIGMLTNVAIVLFASPNIKYEHFSYKAVLFIIVENIIFFLMYVVNYSILPHWYDNHLVLLKELYERKYLNRDEYNLPHKVLRDNLEYLETDNMEKEVIDEDLMLMNTEESN
jgi:hypothetical protein